MASQMVDERLVLLYNTTSDDVGVLNFVLFIRRSLSTLKRTIYVYSVISCEIVANLKSSRIDRRWNSFCTVSFVGYCYIIDNVHVLERNWWPADYQGL